MKAWHGQAAIIGVALLSWSIGGLGELEIWQEMAALKQAPSPALRPPIMTMRMMLESTKITTNATASSWDWVGALSPDVKGLGFHRRLMIDVLTASPLSSKPDGESVDDGCCCYYYLIAFLPREIYIDPFELDRSGFSSAEYLVFGDTDVERPSYLSSESAFVFNVSKEMRRMQQQQQQTLGQLVDIPIHARYCSPVEEPVGSCIRDVDVQIELYLIGEEKGEIQGQNLTMSMRWKIPSVCIRFKQVVVYLTACAIVLGGVFIIRSF